MLPPCVDDYAHSTHDTRVLQDSKALEWRAFGGDDTTFDTKVDNRMRGNELKKEILKHMWAYVVPSLLLTLYKLGTILIVCLS